MQKLIQAFAGHGIGCELMSEERYQQSIPLAVIKGMLSGKKA